MANAGIDRRVDITIPFAGEQMAGWLYRSQKYTAANKGPAIVLGHGLGATKELKLDVYADKFNQLGYTCVVFDYRCNGGSTGLPRALIDFDEQQKDWHAVLAYTREIDIVDPERVGIFGTSFGGGHVIQVGAADKRLKAVIAQCPFTDGLRSSMTTGLSATPKLLSLGLRDGLFGTNEKPVTVPLVGKPGEAALMNAPDVWDGFQPLIPEGFSPQERVPARLILKMAMLRPGAHAAQVQCPLFVAICGKDTVAPPQATKSHVEKAPKGTIKWYDDMGHFDIYIGDKHMRAMKDYVAFLEANMPA
ncbi:Alpha/Beta hydrolase protein [Teratosphaeria destructans]|uniref:Alpha/Beta hydrolase protein n=1 Tax=Teratosphaeria destructans TaxID=418781 RepID=A0A9W7SRR8_9PEZI|nr:Alpha/Beta hydrolase protein [Teratosphaeria destructans]